MMPRIAVASDSFASLQGGAAQNNVSRGMATVLPQQQQTTASMFATRQMMQQRQMTTGPLVIGQIGKRLCLSKGLEVVLRFW